MYSFSFYFFWGVFTFLFSWIFGITDSSFTSVSPYLLLILSIISAWPFSFYVQLLIMWFWAKFRKNTDTLNMLNHDFGNSLLRLGQRLLRLKVSRRRLKPVRWR